MSYIKVGKRELKKLLNETCPLSIHIGVFKNNICFGSPRRVEIASVDQVDDKIEETKMLGWRPGRLAVFMEKDKVMAKENNKNSLSTKNEFEQQDLFSMVDNLMDATTESNVDSESEAICLDDCDEDKTIISIQPEDISNTVFQENSPFDTYEDIADETTSSEEVLESEEKSEIQNEIFDKTIDCDTKQDTSILTKETNCIAEDGHIKTIVDKYKDVANKIACTSSKRVYVFLDDETLAFDSQGVLDLHLNKDMALAPGHQILVASKDMPYTDEQYALMLSLAAKHKLRSYIKRVGESSLILETTEGTVVINNKCWVLDYKQKPVYKQDEVFLIKEEVLDLTPECADDKSIECDDISIKELDLPCSETCEDIVNDKEKDGSPTSVTNIPFVTEVDNDTLKPTNTNECDAIIPNIDDIDRNNIFEAKNSDEDNFIDFSCTEVDSKEPEELQTGEHSFSKGDIVKVNYNGQDIVGTITRIYNAGDTINVSWGTGCTAFFYKNVQPYESHSEPKTSDSDFEYMPF